MEFELSFWLFVSLGLNDIEIVKRFFLDLLAKSQLRTVTVLLLLVIQPTAAVDSHFRCVPSLAPQECDRDCTGDTGRAAKCALVFDNNAKGFAQLARLLKQIVSQPKGNKSNGVK